MKPDFFPRARLACGIALATLFSSSQAHERPELPEVPGITRPASAAAVLRALPLHFVPNAGQADARARFVAEVERRRVEFRDREIGLRFESGEPGQETSGRTVRLQFRGVRPGTRPRGERLAAGRVHYFLGRSPSRWRRDLPTFTEVAYRAIYPGIDASFAGRGGALEATYAVAPGADVARIRLRCPDARSLDLDGEGNLVLETPAGSIRQSRPVAYQLENGERRSLPARFRLDRKERAFGFEIESPYDHSRTLWIYEDEGFICPVCIPTNIRLYSDEDIRRFIWIRHLTRERGVNLAGIRLLFELEERLGARILEALYDEGTRRRADRSAATESTSTEPTEPTETRSRATSGADAGPDDR